MEDERQGQDQLKNSTRLGKDTEDSARRVLLFSLRDVFRNVLYRCPHREFEDIICEIDSADLLAPAVSKWFSARYKVAKRIAWHCPVALNPGVPTIRIKKRYDLFFAVCGSPVDLLVVNTIKNWGEFANVSICLLDELWVKQLGPCKHLLKLLAKFDVIMLYYSQSVEAIGEATGRKCCFLPPAVDTTLFCPYPNATPRSIDVYSIGRRSEVMHQRLLQMAKDDGIFYVYDSVCGDGALNSTEHRALLANIAKRSRYYVVNPALIDQPCVRGDQNEIGNRYFEGAASGALMIGERPTNEEFARLFDWPDAVVRVPYNSSEVAAVIRELDRNPDKQEKMRRNNVVQALKRHDWVYRWETVLRAAGMEPTERLLARKERLKNLTDAIATVE